MKYQNLEVWQRSYTLCIEVYQCFMNHNDWGFKDQITRSSLSIPSNIAEGFERTSEKEKVRFLSFSKGSSGELKTQLMIAKEIGYLEYDTAKRLINEAEIISKLLASLINKIRRDLLDTKAASYE